MDGRHTRWGTLFRADSLHRIPPAAQQELRERGLRTVIDLRRPAEIDEWPNVFATASDVRYRNIDLIGTAPLPATEAWTLAELYVAFLDHRQEQIATVFTTLAEPDGLPGVVHCTAGKDRTGVIIALALALAGVDEETIAADYQLTSEYLVGDYMQEARARAEAAGHEWERYQLQLVCPADYMHSTLRHLNDQYGGSEAYLRRIGLSDGQIDSLRARLVD
jgi:protein-tyrosine phosphatase